MTAPAASEDRFDSSQRSVLNATSSFCVTAGAGSGKTGTLVEYLLSFIEADPENRSLTRVLVMTFSDKAAAELKERVAKGLAARLREASAKGDAEGRVLWERQLRRLGQAQISTIHAYALGLVQAGSHLLGRPGELAVDPGSLHDHLREVLGDLLDEGHPDLKSLMALYPLAPSGGFHDASLTTLLLRILERQSSWGLAEIRSALDGPPPESELAEALAALRSAADGALALIEAKPKWAGEKEVFRSMAENLGLVLAAPDAEIAAGLPRLLKHLHPMIYSPFGNLGRDGKTCKDAIQAAFGQVMGWWAAGEAGPATEALVRLEGLVYRRIRERRLARGQVGFDDILDLARRLLRERPLVRAQEARRWLLIMVDEFQDTNRLQTDLLAQLLADPEGPAADWADLPWKTLEPKLKVVGDPKQSIYRFRGSEPGIMAGLSRELAEGGGRALELSVNYRTQGPLVDFYNALFAGVLGDSVPHHPQESRRAALYPGAPVVCLKGSGGRGSHGLPAGLQAPAIVSYLGDLFSGRAGVMVADKAPGGEGPPRLPGPGDVALLLRRKKNAHTYQKAIEAAGWPCHTLKGRDRLASGEIRGLAASYLFLAGREPDLNLAVALTSPLGPVSEETLLRLVWPEVPEAGTRRSLSWYFTDDAPPFPGGIPADELQTLEEVRDLLAALRPLALRRPAGDTVEALVEGRHVLPLIIGGPDGSPDRVRDVQLFLAKVKALPLTEPLHGGSEADQIEAMLAEGLVESDEAADIGEDPLAGSVNILTVHGSKGLEFPVVIIPEADCSLTGGGGGLSMSDEGRVAISFQSPATGLKVEPPRLLELAAEEKAFSAGEERRLLYVAATRARDHLVLVGKTFAKSETDRWLAMVMDSEAFKASGRTIEFAPEELEPADEPSGPPEGGTPEAGSTEAGSPEGESQRPAGAREGIDPAMVGPPPPARLRSMGVTAWCAKMEGDEALESELEFEGQGEERLEPDVRPGPGRPGLSGPTESKGMGTLFHAVMAASDLAWSGEEYLEELGRRARVLGLRPSEDELGFLADRALRFQRSPLGAEVADALKAERLVKREWPFWLRLDGREPVVHLSGTIDLFFVDAEGRGRIVDYKLSSPDNPHVRAYKRQLEIYSQAIRKAGFGSPELRAELWYSEP